MGDRSAVPPDPLPDALPLADTFVPPPPISVPTSAHAERAEKRAVLFTAAEDGSGAPALKRLRPLQLDTELALIESGATVDSPFAPTTPATTKARRRTPLHEAIVAASESAVAAALEVAASVPSVLDAKDEHGHTPLITAASLEASDGLPARLVRMLLDRGASADTSDESGYTAMHWAAALGHVGVVQLLAESSAPLEARSNAGETPLHRASRLGHAECVRALVRAGADVRARSRRSEGAVEVAGCFEGRVNPKLRQSTLRALVQCAPVLRTLVLSHPDCQLHATRPGHQEAPGRIGAIMSKLTSARIFDKSELSCQAEFEPATREALLRVHSAGYVDSVFTLAASLERHRLSAPVAFTPHVQHAHAAGASPNGELAGGGGGGGGRRGGEQAARGFDVQAYAAELAKLHAREAEALAAAEPPPPARTGDKPSASAGRRTALHPALADGPTANAGRRAAANAARNAERQGGQAVQTGTPPPPGGEAGSSGTAKAAGDMPAPSAPAARAASGAPGTEDRRSECGGAGAAAARTDAKDEPPAMPQLMSQVSSDTSFSKGSLKAALRAAGSAIAAVDAVVGGQYRNAFCAVRPPGHHAGRDGLIEGASSCGFCIFNSVAVAALHALSTHASVRRVAIVDLDVHHGNGTQDVLSRLPAEQWPRGADGSRKDVFFVSMHLYDTNSSLDVGEYQFYPGSGAGEHEDLFSNCLNIALQPLWASTKPTAAALAEQQERAAAAQAAQAAQAADGAAAAPPSGQQAGAAPSGRDTPVSGGSGAASAVAPSAPGAAAGAGAAGAGGGGAGGGGGGGGGGGTGGNSAHGHGRGRRAPALEPLPNACGRVQYRQAFSQRLLPALRAAAPDLILISAGFDAGKRDVGNSRLFSDDRYCQGADLEGHDFSWLTEQLLGVANMVCDGRVVSVLEGGYGHYELSVGRTMGIEPSSLAENVAAHVRALVGRPLSSAPTKTHSRS